MLASQPTALETIKVSATDTSVEIRLIRQRKPDSLCFHSSFFLLSSSFILSDGRHTRVTPVSVSPIMACNSSSSS